ncbi:MAG: tRNA (adenosine(37)-N6)-dimethylallyltransferase MiaA, partial [Pirellulaceae bacterium]
MAGCSPGFEEVRTFDPVQRCWFLTGPTASGKTAVGLELAARIGAEIISVDSMAVYLGMDVGTAKPTLAERQSIPHHLIDIVTPDTEFSLSQYVALAHETVAEIRARNRQVLFVGGTPLYLKSLLRGVYPGPPADWAFRRQIEEELGRVGVQALHERLRQMDPLSAARLHPNDKRRIVRALEVYKVTGIPLSHQQTHFETPRSDACNRVMTFRWPRAHLHQRIETRVVRMFEAGLVGEVRKLLEKYGRLGRTAAQAVGYREVADHLRGKRDLEATVERVTTRTRQFARRQETWFRSLSECEWLEISDAETPGDIA